MSIDKDDSRRWGSGFQQDYPQRAATSSSTEITRSVDPYSVDAFNDEAINFGEQEQSSMFGEQNQDSLYGGEDSGSNSAKSLELKSKKPWEKDPSLGFSTSVYCLIVFGANAGQGAFIGGLLGGIKAYADIQHGSGPTTRRHGVRGTVLRAGAMSGFQFGIWLGTYQASKFLIKKVRGVDDIGNSFGAGFVAGFIRGLHTRSPKVMISSGVMSGAIMTILDHLPEYIQSQVNPVH